MSDSFDVLRVARGGDRLLGLCQRQIVNQAETVSLAQRANLVLAIGIEGREVRLKRAILNAAEIDRLFLTLVPDDELASFVGCRWNDDQGCDHAIELFAVTMR